MISLDISILYQVVLFVILWLILTKILVQPYLRLLDEREQRTVGAQHDTSDLESEGVRLRAQYEQRVVQARATGQAAKDELLQNARLEREKILSDAREEAARVLERVRQEIASASAEERKLAAAEAVNLAMEMAGKALGRKVS